MGFLSTIVSGAAVLLWWIPIFLCVTCICYGLFIKVSNHTVRDQKRNYIRSLGWSITNCRQREKTGILSRDMGQGLKENPALVLGMAKDWAGQVKNTLLLAGKIVQRLNNLPACLFKFYIFSPKNCASYSFTVKVGKKCSITTHTYCVYKQGKVQIQEHWNTPQITPDSFTLKALHTEIF